jgi:anthranilate phosphoribosyltransferase
MTTTEESLRAFGSKVQRLLEGGDLTRRETRGMFREVLENRQPDLHQGAFLAALAAKGETAQEVAGAWEAIVRWDTRTVAVDWPWPLVENSGTGMDALKTFNVSTAAGIVAAAGGVRLARHGARAITSACGTVDVLEQLGIDVECSVDAAAESIRTAGIGLFNGMSPQVHPRALFRILAQIRFGSTLHIAASLASPCRPTVGLRGVWAEAAIPKVVEVMQAIGYRRGMVVHGFDGGRAKGMDEISTIGPTAVTEFFPDGTESSFEIPPEALGLERSRYEEVASLGDPRREAVRLLRILAGRGPRACRDMTRANAGAVLYLAGEAPDIAAGVRRAGDLIDDGRALDTLCGWVAAQGAGDGAGRERLSVLARDAGIGSEVADRL